MKINDNIFELDDSNLYGSQLRADYKKTLDVMFNQGYWENSNFQLLEIINYLLNLYHAKTFPKYDDCLLADSFCLAFSNKIAYAVFMINGKLELLPFISFELEPELSDLLIVQALKTRKYIKQTEKGIELVIFNVNDDLEKVLPNIDDDILQQHLYKYELKRSSQTQIFINNNKENNND